jgi:hypothetical protein
VVVSEAYVARRRCPIRLTNPHGHSVESHRNVGDLLQAFDVPPNVRADLVYAALQLGVERNLWDIEIGSYDGPTSDMLAPE